ncbi:hypothetical protein C3L33_14825, partial [Rhododendron williamsianum]
MDSDSIEKTVVLDIPVTSFEHYTRLWGSCNGLICLSNQEKGIFLWNPSTKKHWKLPVCPIETVPTFSSNVVNAVYGFGYDSVTDDYKVVRVVQHHGVAFMDSEVWVYSLKSNSWKESGGKVLFQYDSGRCKWYDIKEGTVEEASIRGTPGYFEADVCVGSLVRLEGGGGNREKKHATQAKSMKKTNKKKRDDFLSKGFKLAL